MKRSSVIIMAVVCLGGTQIARSEIKNGYEAKLKTAKESLIELQKFGDQEVTDKQKARIEAHIQLATQNLEEISEFHSKTREIIELLKVIDPSLYKEMNAIKDYLGNETDIYIEVVESIGKGLHGATNVEQSKASPHEYRSKHGRRTVSILITDVNLSKSLWALVHELGHVRYQVPHLAEYASFYRKTYLNKRFSGINGHHPSDPGNLYVQETTTNFKLRWKKYKKSMDKEKKAKQSDAVVSFDN